MNTIFLIKKIILMSCFFTVISYASLTIETSKNATNAADWNFELYNKSGGEKGNIVFALYREGMYGSALVLTPRYITSGTKIRLATIDFNDKLTAKIWTEQDTENSKNVFNSARIIAISSGTEKARAIQAINRIPSDFTFVIQARARRTSKYTCFLTWDGKTLRPQTGTLMGLSGKTDSGLDNRNNISPSEITKIID